MSGVSSLPLHWHTCQPCGKRAYHSRRAAQTVRRGHVDKQHLGVYRRCPTSERRVFHIGHVPTTILRGLESRAQYRERTQP